MCGGCFHVQPAKLQCLEATRPRRALRFALRRDERRIQVLAPGEGRRDARSYASGHERLACAFRVARARKRDHKNVVVSEIIEVCVDICREVHILVGVSKHQHGVALP